MGPIIRAALKIKEGGLSLGSWDATHAAAFLSALVASIPHLARVLLNTLDIGQLFASL